MIIAGSRSRRDTEDAFDNYIISPNTSRLYVEFISDSHTSYKGFNITYDIQYPASKYGECQTI